MINLGEQAGMIEEDIIRFIAEGLRDEEAIIRELRSVGGYDQLKRRDRLLEESRVNRLGFSSAAKKPIGKADSRPAGQGASKENEARCFACGKVGHVKRDCPEKVDDRRCYRCGQPGHLSSRCPERDGGGTAQQRAAQANWIEYQEPVYEKGQVDGHVNQVKGGQLPGTSREGNRNWKEVAVAGVRMVAQIDSGSDFNLMREDTFKQLQQVAIQGRPEKLKGVGGDIWTLGKAEISTRIDEEEYTLLYRVIQRNRIPEMIILGEDLQDKAVIQLGPGQPTVTPGNASRRGQEDDGEMEAERGQGIAQAEAEEARRLLKELRAEKE